MHWFHVLLVSALAALPLSSAGAQEDAAIATLRKAVGLYASFDDEVRMDFGQGEPIPGTRSVSPTDKKTFVFDKGFDAKHFKILKGKGIAGGCLQAVDLPPRNGRLFFAGKGNVAFQKQSPWGGAFSVWVNTDPNLMLKTPFCDPVLITQKGFNNGSIWAHFNDAKPRALQSGTYPSVPDGQEPVPEDDPQAPLTRLKDVRFKDGEWHHLVLSWDRFNSGKKDGTHTLWIDGKKIGTLKDYDVSMDWDIEKTRVYFAVNLIGLLDELAVFNRPLDASEVALLHQKPGVLQPIKASAKPAEQYGARRTSIDIGAYKGFVLHPEKPASDGTRPWVWYAPTIGSHPNKSNEWILKKLLDRGFHVAGINVGESFGSPTGRKAFTDFHQHLVKEYKLDAKASLLAQSRGGLMLYNWAAENPDKVRCIVGIYPVCDLRSYPGLARAAGAYGLSPAELEKQLTKHNPIDRLEPLAKARIPILHVHGDKDTVVPLDKNSQVVFDRYQALGGKMQLIVVPGKGHAEIAEFFQEPRLVQFLLDGALP